MKGLQHDVIEIRETDSEEIEKILVFLKPGEHKINVSATRAEAADILQRVKIKKTRPGFRLKIPVENTRTIMLVCGFVALAVCRLLLL